MQRETLWTKISKQNMRYIMKQKHHPPPKKNETKKMLLLSTVLKPCFAYFNFFKEIELFSMCIQLSTCESGKCVQSYLVCRWADTFFFLREVPFAFSFVPHGMFWKEIIREPRITLEWCHLGTARGTRVKNREGFMEHKLLHVVKRTPRSNLIIVQKYLCEIKNTKCLKGFGAFFLFNHEEKWIKRSNSWRLKPGKPEH